ncbi:hypothetical protein P8452_72212 [Trifolium repens]|nr:hypothetical protein P8452_72212 [Trifolium repens]
MFAERLVTTTFCGEVHCTVSSGGSAEGGAKIVFGGDLKSGVFEGGRGSGCISRGSGGGEDEKSDGVNFGHMHRLVCSFSGGFRGGGS